VLAAAHGAWSTVCTRALGHAPPAPAPSPRTQATYFGFVAAGNKPSLFIAQFFISGGTGALYTTQASTIRLVADVRA
jgi:hypothetical protein